MKFKNIKKKANTKSPSNSRVISDSVKASSDKSALFLKIYRGALKAFVVFIFILAVVIVGLDLEENIKDKQSIDSEREKLTKELVFWESFIQEQENYRDAYFQASILEYKLGNKAKAKMYIEKGLSLDPTSENGLKIEEFLNK